MDFIVKFAAASSAALILSGCVTGCIYGPPPSDSPESAETQSAAITAPAEQHNSQELSNTQNPGTITRTSVLYGPPPK